MKKSFFGNLTLLQQWALATLLAVLPLLLAVGYAVFSLHQQTDQRAATMQRFDRLTETTGRLLDDVHEQVRVARNYLLLRDETFLELFKQKNEGVRDTLNALESLSPEPQWREILATLRSETDLLERYLSDIEEAQEDNVTLMVQALLLSSDQLDSSVATVRRLTLRQGEQDFARIVDRLFLITMLTLPGTFLLMILGTFLVSRPIWRLSVAIRRLGRQHWEEPIRVKGPADIVALGENLEWMRQQICASDEQKTAFIQHVTHELKTPLAAIIEAASLMRDEITGPLQSGQKEVLEILFNNARQLEDLIQKLLNYNAVSHEFMAEVQPVELETLCASLRHQLEMSDVNKRLNWLIEGNAVTVPSDPRLLEMILANLLSNAFHFTESGGSIAVNWDVTPEGWWLRVVDTGTGIETDELDKIFTSFYRGSNTRQSSRRGNGIGLAIVKASTELLKGDISVQSSKGVGTAFELFFPNIVESIP